MIVMLVFTALALFAVLAVVGWAVGIYNALVALKNAIEMAWSNIDVLLKQRHDELVKLLEVVKGVRDFEQGTLVKVTEARAAYEAAGTRHQAIAAAQAEGLALRGLFAVAEAYPQLKADANFMQLQTRVSELENQIADRREAYNDTVNLFNTRIEQFPDNLFAGLLNYRRREYFRPDAAETKDVDLSFK